MSTRNSGPGEGTSNAFLAAVGGVLTDVASKVVDTATGMALLRYIVDGIDSADSCQEVPTADSAANVVMRDVIGNKSDTMDGTSLMAYIKMLKSKYLISGTSPDTSGTANTSTRIELDGDASSTDGAYDPAVIMICSGTGAGQARQIWEYDGTNKYAYINRDWKVIPDDTSTYCIMADAGDTHVNEGVATGGGASTITLNTLAVAQDNVYNGQVVFIVAGTGTDQSRGIVGYNGTTKVATVDAPWIVQPDTTSVYAMLPFPGSGSTLNVPQFAGIIAYVDAAVADDTGNGITPTTPKKTIGAAQAVAGVGGALSIKAGTYTEVGLNMSYAAQEWWCEIGTTISPATGTALTVSAASCKVIGQLILIPSASNTGLSVTAGGAYSVFEDITASAGDYNYEIAGAGITMRRCVGAAATTASWNVTGNSVQIIESSTAGIGASKGYSISGDYAVLRDCTSLGHTVSGFIFESGASGGTIKGCSSGAGDGRWVDTDHANVWSGFTYDNEVFKDNTLSISGSASAAYNLFRVQGAVKILAIVGDVETALTGTNTDAFLEVWSSNNQEDISKDVDCDLGALGVGSIIMKLDKTDKVLSVGDATSGPFIVDQIDSKEEGFRLGEDHSGGTEEPTYIRFNHTCAASGTGVIHWHCIWEPVDESGFVTAV